MKVYKNEGETPLECLNRLRIERPELKEEVLSYAGRLDPMAEGDMLILVGEEENKNREKYLKLDKEYEVDILFGIATDTGDILGKVLDVIPAASQAGIQSISFNSFVGNITLPYPPYSSRTVKGKPLHQWAREGKINKIEIPTKISHIYSIDLLDSYKLNTKDVLEQVTERVGKVRGDFRQGEVIESWREKLRGIEGEFSVLKIKIRCSSGTYMRSLAEEIGKKLNVPAIAWKIKRTAI